MKIVKNGKQIHHWVNDWNWNYEIKYQFPSRLVNDGKGKLQLISLVSFFLLLLYT